MFLFCVFSWLIEKYENVILMLMRFWSGICGMFLCMFWGVIILRLKNVYSIEWVDGGEQFDETGRHRQCYIIELFIKLDFA